MLTPPPHKDQGTGGILTYLIPALPEKFIHYFLQEVQLVIIHSDQVEDMYKEAEHKGF